ncbi:MAG TPA: SGNH/GDSL hydrolase family protein [Candidatus Didemnitutus sp.]|nr:SGNH/GDSL hydrolase family protein [Candidatus Didemnitutus sp.]
MPPAPGLTGETLREIIHPTLSGPRLRLVLSNVFGNAPLVLDAVRVAQSAGASAISPATDTAVTFNGSQAITIPPGASLLSDPVSFAVVAQRDIAVSLSVRSAPAALTGHPGSRTTSYIQAGDLAGAADLPKAHAVDHWYLLAEVDVPAAPPASAVIVIGDSITDGRGSTTNGNNRWPDNLARRLEADPATAGIAVLNQGIGGNALLHGGLGPTALARFDRDVLGPCGGRWLIVFEGINDLGGATGARAHGRPATTAADLIGALRQIAERGHSHGLRVYGATITPFSGFTMYYTPESEADRRAINQWIRTTSELDAVIDFDAAVRDPADASRLVAAYDCGDHLHLSVAGYERLAASIDLKLFQP